MMKLGSIDTIQDALRELRGARLGWAQRNDVYAQLGVALREAEKALALAERAAEKGGRRCDD